MYVYRYSIGSIRRFNPQLLLPVSRELMVVVSWLEAVRFLIVAPPPLAILLENSISAARDCVYRVAGT